ncbi:MAG: phosphocholine cytidylyltransferase family protein [Candidatus Fermentibacteraceae bacterium]
MESSDTAVILAAGRGARLEELSHNMPKPLVEVGGRSILSNLVESLIDNGFGKIVLVVGYRSELIIDHLQEYAGAAELVFVENPDFDITNNIYSLWLAREHLDRGFCLFEADVFFQSGLIGRMMHHPAENVMVVDGYTPRMDGTVVSLDGHGRVAAVHLKRSQGEDFDYSGKFKTVNFYRIGAGFYADYFRDDLDSYIEDGEVSYYYEAIIRDGIDAGHSFAALRTGDLSWWEIDTKEDLERAEAIFEPQMG